MTETAKIDARKQRSAVAMLDAVHAIMLEEGAGAVTHQRVAERAGVGRATVYRHWPTVQDMLRAAFESGQIPFLLDDAGSFQERIFIGLRRLADTLNAPAVRSVALSVIERAPWDEAARAIRDRVEGQAVANLRRALAEVRAAGEPYPEMDASELMARLFGPVWFRLLVQDQPVTDAFIRLSIDAALATPPAPHERAVEE